jgi:ATP-binding cassette, subfamily B, bacterial
LDGDFLKKPRELLRLRRAVDMVWKGARGWTIASLVLMVPQALLPLAVLYLIKLLVDSVAAGITAPDKVVALQEIMLLVLWTGLITLAIAACRAAAEVVEEHKSQLVTDYVADVIHRQSAAVDLAYYEDSKYHDTFYRAQQEALFRPTRIVRDLTGLVQHTISLIALAGLLIYLHWSIALILFAAAIPGVIVAVRHSRRLYRWYSRRTETERRVYDYHNMLTDVFYAKELRLFDLGGLFRQRFRDLRAVLRGERLGLAKARSRADLLAQAVAVVSLFGMIAFIAWQTLIGVLTLGALVMYYQAFQRAQTALQAIMAGLARLYEHNLFLNYFYGFLDLKPLAVMPEATQAPPRPMRRGIRLEGVTFRYPMSERDVLREVDLAIGPGQVIALVGDNGAGKTTIAKLLCRLYDPAGGRITMDGLDYQHLDVRQLRREITMIFQDYIQYPLTARENIWIGDILSDPDGERVARAARQAGAEGVINRLSGGFDTMLGKRFEKGDEISIGEWQKIALSRAFLRDAQLIILDEPTSAMSIRAEYELFQSFKELLNGRSALLISHRFSTVRMADLICVLEEGRIVEQGSHENLIRQGGRYADLYGIQARHYK